MCNYLNCGARVSPHTILQLFKKKGGRFRRYTPSAQTHCQAADVERWIEEAADANGVIKNVSVEIHGVPVSLSNAAEAHVIGALFAADHNDYVTRNLQYVAEAPTGDEVKRASDSAGDSDDEAYRARQQLDPEFELNEDLTLGEFGPSHSRHSNW